MFHEYGEDDNITKKEVIDYFLFMYDVKNNAPDGYYFSHFNYGEDVDSNFKLCEVTNLLNDCVDIEAIYFKRD